MQYFYYKISYKFYFLVYNINLYLTDLKKLDFDKFNELKLLTANKLRKEKGKNDI